MLYRFNNFINESKTPQLNLSNYDSVIAWIEYNIEDISTDESDDLVYYDGFSGKDIYEIITIFPSKVLSLSL